MNVLRNWTFVMTWQQNVWTRQDPISAFAIRKTMLGMEKAALVINFFSKFEVIILTQSDIGAFLSLYVLITWSCQS